MPGGNRGYFFPQVNATSSDGRCAPHCLTFELLHSTFNSYDPGVSDAGFFCHLAAAFHRSLTGFSPLLHLCSVLRYLLKGDFPLA